MENPFIGAARAIGIDVMIRNLPKTYDVFDCGPWWKRLFRKRFIFIDRGPVYLGDSIVYTDMTTQTRHEINSTKWDDLVKQEKLVLVGSVKWFHSFDQ